MLEDSGDVDLTDTRFTRTMYLKTTMSLIWCRIFN